MPIWFDLFAIAFGLLLPKIAQVGHLRLRGQASLLPIVFIIGGVIDLISKLF